MAVHNCLSDYAPVNETTLTNHITQSENSETSVGSMLLTRENIRDFMVALCYHNTHGE